MNLNLDKARVQIDKEFFGMQDYVDILEIALTRSVEKPLSSNVIFYGPGGYGKSEMTSAYLEYATGTKPFIATFHEGMTQAEQAGGYDIPSLQKGELKYLLEHSFMNHEVVILEEIGDARPQVLASLKQTLTSGVFSFPGIKPFPIKTKLVVGLTNKDTAEFRDNDSNKALMERFPLQRRVSWDDLSVRERQEGIHAVVKKFSEDKSVPERYVMSAISNLALDRNLSPRMIGKITEIYNTKLELWKKRGRAQNNNDLIISVFRDMGYQNVDAIENKTDETIFQDEMQRAKKNYFEVLGKINQVMKNIEKLNDAELNSPSAMQIYLPQILRTRETIETMKEAVTAIRLDTSFGHLSDELASELNLELSKYEDRLDKIHYATWDCLATVCMKEFVNKQDNSEGDVDVSPEA